MVLAGKSNENDSRSSKDEKRQNLYMRFFGSVKRERERERYKETEPADEGIVRPKMKNKYQRLPTLTLTASHSGKNNLRNHVSAILLPRTAAVSRGFRSAAKNVPKETNGHGAISIPFVNTFIDRNKGNRDILHSSTPPLDLTLACAVNISKCRRKFLTP